ncbi:MAG: hypothetical protein PHP69_02490 [Candidatus Omnitrophica bacterium]|nr:hypothetical protein [Candidatus Omnitrophota bacterium]MDD5080843.1 hypothetical protein [Candidatus Omnitrophota bacterium]
MSVIYEALKKAEEAKKERTINEKTKVNRPKKNKNTFYVILIILSLFSAVQILFLHKEEKSFTGFSYHPLTNDDKNAYSLNKRNGFVLQGIVKDNDSFAAYINNDRVVQGGKVDSASVVKIDAVSVELDDLGEIINLTLK